MTSFSSIESLLAFWEVAEYTGTAIVLLGVVGELVAEHDWPSNETKRKRLTRYSTWILVAGLAIEAVALVRSNQLAGRLIAELHRAAESANATAKGFEKDMQGANERIATAKSSAAGALATAKGFESQISASKLAASQADERAKEAVKAAEGERLERVRLEAQIAPRRLTTEQKVAIGNACRVFSLHLFSRRSVAISSYTLDLEAAVLAQQIRDALSSAGLIVKFNPSSFMPLGGFTTGIQVSGPMSQQDIVLGIAESLSRDGKLGVAKPEFTGPDTAVSIMIGVKPIS